jgi:thymidylate synthase
MAKIDIKYHKLLEVIKNEGFKYEDPNRKGVHRLQIPSYTIKHDFKDGFPALTTKKLAWKSIVVELLWILRGDTNIKYLVDNGIPIWNKDALNYANSGKLGKGDNLTMEQFLKEVKASKNTGDIGDVGRNYSAQLRNWKGQVNPSFKDEKGFNSINTVFDKLNINYVDQLSNLINTLKTNPMATKKTVTFWNPAESEETALTPCHWSFEILVEPYFSEECKHFTWGNCSNYIDEECLCKNDISIPKYQFTLKWHQHSVDTFLGKM